ncbi:MAG: GspE/PulE family protein [Bacillota bacterium]
MYGGGQIINNLHSLIGEANRDEASDIHLEQTESGGRVRFRIDGLLQTKEEQSVEIIKNLIARVKLLAGLDITVHNMIQEGSISGKAWNTAEIRISIMPTVRGEKAVLRLRGDKKSYQLHEIGFSPDNFQVYKKLIRVNQGLILFTGPTGSGKSTTLLATISELNQPDLNIITLEDPVEIRLPSVNQLYVNTANGSKFAEYLRAVLRQDPDIIMVGEIRDLETAAMAVRAALTGHQVFSTIHTADSVGAIIRLIEMGIPSYLVGANLKGVIAQRLIRKFCQTCLGQGCSNCNHTGYKGRKAIHEVLPITDEIKKLIIQSSSETEIKKAASKAGVIFLKEAGVIEVKNNVTSQDELERILNE